MKYLKPAWLLAMGLLAFAAVGAASAHGGSRLHFGFAFGAPAYWYQPFPYYYYPPASYYYPPAYAYPPLTAPAAPTRYIERGDASQDTRRDYWYYCPETKTYYPYVKQCAGGWQKVDPKPADG
jgi:hypothetical protein